MHWYASYDCFCGYGSGQMASVVRCVAMLSSFTLPGGSLMMGGMNVEQFNTSGRCH
jgi:hypothetical protein